MANKKVENKATKETNNALAGAMTPPATKEVYSTEMLKELDKHYKAVKQALSGIDKSFEKVIFNLYWIYENNGYKATGCDTIVDYASKYFDFQKSSTYSFINVAERFGKRDEAGHILAEFDEKYKEYSSSKLSILLDLSDEEIETLEIKPTMSVRDIRKKVNSYLKSLEDTQEEQEEAIGDTESESVSEMEDSEPENISNNLIVCNGLEDYNSKIDKIDALIMRLLKKHRDYKIIISYEGVKDADE